MKTWKTCSDEAGLTGAATGAPEKIFIYYGYKNGVAKRFDTKLLAQSFSSIIERVADLVSDKAYNDYWADLRTAENKAHEIWLKALEQEFDYIDKEVFDMCYAKAFEDGHSNGRDSVYSKMEEYVDFAIEIANIYECRNK